MSTASRLECQCCRLPAGTRHIALAPKSLRIGEDGLCSYCEFRRQSEIDFFDHERYRRMFEQRLDRFRGKYRYDALVGLSGGKDGAYVLHRLTREYGLRVLAFTFDNGFLNETAVAKIGELVQIYGVDHQLYRPVHLRQLYRAVVKQAAVPCHACAMGGYYRALAVQLQERIPLFVHGRSPYQMLRNLDQSTFENDPYFSLIRSNLEPYDAAKLRASYANMFQGIKVALRSLGLSDEARGHIMEEFFAPLQDITAEFVPESFAFFLTERYDEAAIRSVLQREAGFVAPASHDDCLIHNAANHLTARQYGVSVQTMEAAAMLRHGHISAAEYARQVCSEADMSRCATQTIASELDLLCQALGIDASEVAAWPPNEG